MGCPLKCSYCASRMLSSRVRLKDPDKVISRAGEYVEKYNIKNIAFYDDALLYNFNTQLKIFLHAMGKKGPDLIYHTPNGLHIKSITEEIAESLYRFNFKTLRLSLETSDARVQKITGKRISRKMFIRVMKYLHKAGFSPEGLEVYVLFGLPQQGLNDIKDTIKFIKDHGGRPKIVEYSLIPGTEDSRQYYNNKNIDPLLTNNSIFYQTFTSFTSDDLFELRQMSKITP